MPEKKKTARDYPYKIPPLESFVPDPIPLAVSKYFLAEALLRSPKALATYPKNEKKFLAIFKDYGLNINPLLGEHHVLMRASNGHDQGEDDMCSAVGFVKNPDTGIVDINILDLGVVAKLGPSVFWPNGGEAEILHLLRNPLPRFICLRLDLSSTATAIKNNLMPFLMKKCEQYKETPMEDPLEQLHRNALRDRFDDIPAWINYFKCYDLWWPGALSYSQIAYKVYGTPKSRGKAKTAIKRADEAIAAAENHTWPPKDSSHKLSR